MADKSLLLSNASATGTARAYPADTYMFIVDGTFDGATVALKMLSPDGASWMSLTGASLTAEGYAVLDLPAGSYRVEVSGGAPAALYAALKPCGAR